MRTTFMRTTASVYVDRQRVVPYVGNFAAWGPAVEAGRVRDAAVSTPLPSAYPTVASSPLPQRR